jgi:hypothetical protein
MAAPIRPKPQTTRFPEAKAEARISSLEKKPDRPGMPEMASAPIRKTR